MTVDAARGDVVDLSFAEVMDREGNFYTANYRSAKCKYHYVCRDGNQTWHPRLTFFGFRYIRVNDLPGGVDRITPNTFRAHALHSEMKRMGYALAIRFGLAPDGQTTSDQLDAMVRDCGYLKTGFVGTPHILYALSMYGHYDTAYDLLLREDYPVMVVFCPSGRNYHLGALGRYHGERRVLGSLYEFV